MLALPAHLESYSIRGLRLRQLIPEDQAQMMQMQEETLATLEDPAWFFPSEEWEFKEWLQNREAFGYFDGDTLVGYAALGAWNTRGERAYALKLGEAAEDTYDFHDILVRPAYRRRGIHTSFLRLFEEMAHVMGGRALYATVDPGNAASWHNFEKAGYVCVCVKPAYDGRMRRYYKRSLLSGQQPYTRCHST